MPTTPRFLLPFPAGTDAANGPGAIQALALRVELMLGIRGVVNSSGSRNRGSGFSSTRTGVGLYTVTFDTAFAAVPVVQVGSENGTTFTALVSAAVDHFDVVLVSGDQAPEATEADPTDARFNFIAVPI